MTVYESVTITKQICQYCSGVRYSSCFTRVRMSQLTMVVAAAQSTQKAAAWQPTLIQRSGRRRGKGRSDNILSVNSIEKVPRQNNIIIQM